MAKLKHATPVVPQFEVDLGKVMAHLRKIAPGKATSDEIAKALGMKKHKVVELLTALLDRDAAQADAERRWQAMPSDPNQVAEVKLKGLRDLYRTMPNGGALLIVTPSGGVGNGHYLLASFTSKAKAEAALTELGWFKQYDNPPAWKLRVASEHPGTPKPVKQFEPYATARLVLLALNYDDRKNAAEPDNGDLIKAAGMNIPAVIGQELRDRAEQAMATPLSVRPERTVTKDTGRDGTVTYTLRSDSEDYIELHAWPNGNWELRFRSALENEP